MPETPQSSGSGSARKLAWLFSARAIGVILFSAACLLTLIALFYTEENWRGKRAWQSCRHELESKGETLDWATRISRRVPDEQNIFKAPHLSEWFVKNRPGNNYSNAFATLASAVTTCAQGRRGEPFVVGTISQPLNTAALANADVILHFSGAPNPRFAAADIENLSHALCNSFGGATLGSPSLKGAQGTFVFVAGPTNLNRPLHLAIVSDATIKTEDLHSLFDATGRGNGSSPALGFRVEFVGSNQFKVSFTQSETIFAASYLECADELSPPLDELRKALERPFALLDVENTPPWGSPIPNFVAVRTAAQAIAQRAQCYLLVNQPDQALKELTLLHGMHRLLDPQPVMLVSAMIDVAVRGLYTSIVAEGLRLHVWREPQLITLQQQLHGVRLLTSLRAAIDTERAASCELFGNTPASQFDSIFDFAQKTNLWAKLTEPSYALSRFMPRGWIYQNMKSIALQDQWFMEACPSNGVVKPSEVDELGEKSIRSLQKLSPYNVLARIAMPNYLKAFQTTVRNQAMAAEAYLACGLERFRLTHNDYPPDLDALTPGLADNVPPDPVNGGKLRYRRLGADDYLLYSVGWDGIDEGGRTGKSAAEGDWVWDRNQ